MWNTKVQWSDCKEALASIGRVAKDVIERLRAEFHSEDLYLAYQAFDVSVCSKISSAATPDAPLKARLERAGRKLCTALGITHDKVAWRAATKIAVTHWQHLIAQRETTASTSDDSADDNRRAWRAAMEASNFPPSVVPAVRFYLATWDGTGAVERGLGQDAAIQQQHVGQRARSCPDADIYSGLLELHLDGPQDEASMFKRTDEGVLLFTEFSRSCAQEWLSQRGRRFACYKTRKDQGTKRPERLKGTDRAVQLLARSAYQQQRELAKADLVRASTPGAQPAVKRQTVLGVDRLKLIATVSRLPASQIQKQPGRFRLATARKLAEKKASGTWCGWSQEVPRPRLGGAAQVVAATHSAAVQATRARMWLGGQARRQARASSIPIGSGSCHKRKAAVSMNEPVPSSGGHWKRRRVAAKPQPSATAVASSSSRVSTNDGQKLASSASTPGATRLSSSKPAKGKEYTIDKSLETMVKQRAKDPDTKTLLSWLQAITTGGIVSCEQRCMAVQSSLGSSCAIRLEGDFAKKHPCLAGALRTAAQASKGKWAVGAGASMPSSKKLASNVYTIARKRDVVPFLLQARRVAPSDPQRAFVSAF